MKLSAEVGTGTWSVAISRSHWLYWQSLTMRGTLSCWQLNTYMYLFKCSCFNLQDEWQATFPGLCCGYINSLGSLKTLLYMGIIRFWTSHFPKSIIAYTKQPVLETEWTYYFSLFLFQINLINFMVKKLFQCAIIALILESGKETLCSCRKVIFFFSVIFFFLSSD